MTGIRDLLGGSKDLTVVGMVDIIVTVIGGLFWFYIAILLGAEQYGQVSYFIAIAGMSSSIALLGSENVLTVYTAKNVRLQSAVYFISIVSGIITSIVLFFIIGKFEVSLLVLGYVIFGLAVSEMLGRKVYGTYARYIIISKLLTVVLSIGLYFVLGVIGIIIGIAFSSFLFVGSIYNGFRTVRIDFSLIKARMNFMLTSYVTNLSDRFIASLDKLIIAPMLGFVILGNYQLGLQFLEVLHILPSIVFKYTLPHDASGNPNKKLKKMTIIASAGIAALAILLSPFLIPSVFPKYVESIQVIQILSISLVPSTISTMYASKFLGTEKNRIILYGSLIFLVTQIALIIWLGRIFGANGAAIGFDVGVICQTIFYLTANKYQSKSHE
ncbi:MAG: polysaccharide biosynthesis C-terminal domain-containing protein [Candidatus Nitrosotenuis sp.]